VSESIWLRETKNLLWLLGTLLLFLWHPNPIFKDTKVRLYNDKYDVALYYSLNSIFTLISLARLWFFIKYYLVSSEFNSTRVQRICEMNNFKSNLNFSLKASMIKSPSSLLLILFLIVLIFCAFGVRIFERELDNLSGKNFGSYWNVIWCLIITMTTVGYGDYFPSTVFGRIIGIICCICGVVLVSMLIVTITNILNFDPGEETVFSLLERISLSEDKDKLAARLVSRYIKLMKILKSKKNSRKFDKNDREKLRDGVLLSLLDFKDKCHEIDFSYTPYSEYDNILDDLDMLDQNLDEVILQYRKLNTEVNEDNQGNKGNQGDRGDQGTPNKRRGFS
jgi:hypothetical protein